MFKLFKKDWNDYVSMIEKRKRAYLTYPHASRYAYSLLQKWEKAIVDATEYLDLNASTLDARQLASRKTLMTAEKNKYITESTKLAAGMDRKEANAFRGSGT